MRSCIVYGIIYKRTWQSVALTIKQCDAGSQQIIEGSELRVNMKHSG